MTVMAVKVTSVGSESGCPTPPNPSPHTDALNSPNAQPNTDFEAVGSILVPIQEELNDSADAAMYPSPPINTPEAFSPAPSVAYKARSRGLSAVGDRLAQLKLEERSHGGSTPSDRSIVASLDGDDDRHEADSSAQHGSNTVTSPLAFNRITPRGIGDSIPIVLGSPSSNPRIDEYLTFQSNELPVTNPDKRGSSSTQVATGNEGIDSRECSIRSVKSDNTDGGVTEKSTWAEEVEDAAERAVMQLEQLALDEYIVDPSRSIKAYYIDRLERLLTDAKREFPVQIAVKLEVDASAQNTSQETQ